MRVAQQGLPSYTRLLCVTHVGGQPILRDSLLPSAPRGHYRAAMQQKRDTHDTIASLAATLVDVIAIVVGIKSALWLRFNLPWFLERYPDKVPAPEAVASEHLLFGLAVILITFRVLGLHRRPQYGRFEDKIPRIVRAVLTGLLLYVAVEAIRRIDPEFPRAALVLAVFTILFCVLLARYILYRIEWNLARHMEKIHHVLIIGTDQVAARLESAIRKEPFLRSEVVGFLRTPSASDENPCSPVLGDVDALSEFLEQGRANQVILADININHSRMVDIIVDCEKHFASFYLVPDMFRVLTSGLEIQNMGNVPVMGISKWPLDYLHNRMLKRMCDVIGAGIGLIGSLPIIVIAGLAIKASSPGPMFYRQTRCGQNGKEFTMVKLRTMQQDAETSEDQPGWTKENDPRRTRIGGFLRKYNIDELPQFWNVLQGHMSLVGPRPERPYFVDKFQEQINRYMRRHIQKPGISGWAQVNGLRGDTSIEERIKFDLYYLENWSLAFDFKIILKTLLSRKNAY